MFWTDGLHWQHGNLSKPFHTENVLEKNKKKTTTKKQNKQQQQQPQNKHCLTFWWYIFLNFNFMWVISL